MNKNYNHNALDIFRIVATIQVFLGHTITHFHLPQYTNVVYFLRGVPILFVLCGFLAAKSLSQSDAKTYLVRRAIRILPGFWACIVVNTGIIFSLYTLPTLKDGVIYFLTQFFGMNFYTGDWLRGYGVGTPNGVLWTIGVQVQFFLLAPMLCRLLHKLKLAGSVALIGILTALSILIEQYAGILPEIGYKLIGVTVLPYLYFLLLGMAGWIFRDRVIPAMEKMGWILLPVFVAWKLAEIYLPFAHMFDGVMYNTVTTLLTSLLIFAFGFRFSWRMKRDLTYGFYLYHMVFINIVIHLGCRTLDFNLQSGIVVLCITVLPMLAAWVSQKWIEKPAAKLRWIP